MDTMTAQAEPRLKHKSFSYRTNIRWEEKKRGVIASEGKPAVVVASPPEFKGEAGRWTPEDLLIAAIDSCAMTTFMSFAGRLGLGVVSYSSRAEGLLEFTDGGYRFTRVVLRPTIVVRSAGEVGPATQAIHDAHENCLIARSVRAEVVMEPEVTHGAGASS